MAHLIKQKTILWVKDKKRVPANTPGAERIVRESKKWYACNVPGHPVDKRIPLSTNKSVAQRQLAKLITKGERGEAGIDDKTTEARKELLEHHLEAFRVHLVNKGTSAKTINLALTRCRAVFDGCYFQYPQDIDAAAVEGFLASKRQLLPEAGGLSAQTVNYYLGAVSQFCNWMVRRERLARNPMLEVFRANPKHDRRHDRRAFTHDELERVLETARTSKRSARRLKGPDRYMLYALAYATGFRSQELASLTPESFNLDGDLPTVTLAARRSKAKKKTIHQPIAPWVVPELREYLQNKQPGEPVWPGPWWKHSARMLRKDLEDAKVPYTVKGPDGPLYADFHAFRHTYCSEMVRAGVSPKTAQELARHSTIKLTLDRYTHAEAAALAQAASQLPRPGNGHPQAMTLEQEAAAFYLAAVVLGEILKGVNMGVNRTDR